MKTNHRDICTFIALLVAGLTTTSFAGFVGQVVNFDFNVGVAQEPGANLFAQDTAILSSPGGVTWNEVESSSGSMVQNVPDQFGSSTPVDLAVLQSDSYTGLTAANELQDSGLATPEVAAREAFGGSIEGGGQGQIELIVSGLLQQEFYDLSVYIAGGDPKSGGTSVGVAHAGGMAFGSQNFEPTYILPGQLGGDYYLFSGLMPSDQGGGDYGFLVTASPRFFGEPAYVGGLQVRGVVPEPATLGLLLVGVASLWRYRRRCQA